MKTLEQIITECQDKYGLLQKIIPAKDHSLRIAEIDEQMNKSGFWSDQTNAARLTKERAKLVEQLAQLKSIGSDLAFITEFAREMPKEIETLHTQIASVYGRVCEMELCQILNGENDGRNAILTLTAGSGGLESANFVSMLLRMYLRYCDSRGWKTEILDEKPSSEHSDICLDSVSVQVNGECAYGWLKCDSGIFRLIRNSPFNSGGARHTSFAAISVMADIDDSIEVDIKEEDLEWEVCRASGSGGQGVNRTESAVRIRHLPSGIFIKVQAERSQHENRRIALKLLKNKLYSLEVEKRNKENDKIINTQSNAGFGSQIRSITLSPYTLVKDHRTGYETIQAEKYLDGSIHEFLLSNLYHLVK